MRKGSERLVRVLLALIVSGAPVVRAALAPTDAAMVEKPGTILPLDTPLRDERGGRVTLRETLLGKPTVLALAYYRCPNLCTLVFNGLVDALAKMRGKPGEAFNIVALSIDPRDTPELARMKKRTYLSRLGIANEDSRAWRFLSGDAEPVRAIADAVGFRYAWDPATREYAHPAGIIVISPTGKVDRYFPGIRYDPVALEGALRAAGSRPARAPLAEFFMTCLHYDPGNSRRSRLVLDGIRLLGAAGLCGLVLGGVWLARSRKGTVG